MNFDRKIVFIPAQKDILLEYSTIFKLYNCPKDYPRPKSSIAHHPCFLEYSFESRTNVMGVRELSYMLDTRPRFSDFKAVPIPDHLVKSIDSTSRREEVMDLLNAISGEYIFSYSGYQAWFRAIESHQEASFGQELYTHQCKSDDVTEITPTPNYENIDPIALTMIRTNNDGHDTEFTVSMSHLFATYFEYELDDLKRGYRNACRIVSLAKKFAPHSMSASFLFMVTAIESLIQIKYKGTEPTRCSECQQEQYKVTKKFMDFLDEYCPGVDKKQKNRIYKLRSSLVHSGMLMSGTQHPFFYENEDDIRVMYDETINSLDHQALTCIALTCFRVFLYKHFQPMGG